MTQIPGQMVMTDAVDAGNDEYEAFVDKFKPKLTTDDCYTPDAVYDAVCKWVENEYGVNRANFVRPFWPGADYQAREYPEGCIVVDNPPFSIYAKIVRWYLQKGIQFFLFAPSKTAIVTEATSQICVVGTGASVTYKNGAVVNTSFVTTLDNCMARSAPELRKAVEEASKNELQAKKIPRYAYPDNIITTSMLEYLSRHGIEYKMRKGLEVSALDEQRLAGKGIFGRGWLVSNQEAARKRAAEQAAKRAAEQAAKRAAEQAEEQKTVWKLSQREEVIVGRLGSTEE